MIEFVRKVFALKRKVEDKAAVVEQGVSAWDHALIAYHRGASLPGILRIASGITDTKSDDALDDAVVALLGEVKQTVYNGSEIMRTNAVLLTSIATQLDEIHSLLEQAENDPLKNVLEDYDA